MAQFKNSYKRVVLFGLLALSIAWALRLATTAESDEIAAPVSDKAALRNKKTVAANQAVAGQWVLALDKLQRNAPSLNGGNGVSGRSASNGISAISGAGGINGLRGITAVNGINGVNGMNPLSEPNPFSVKSWYAPPPPPPLPTAAVLPPLPPPIPTAPPLPFSYVGKFQQQVGKWVIYLAKGDQTYAVSPGDAFDNVYRFEGIENDKLVIQYLPLSTKQFLLIGADIAAESGVESSAEAGAEKNSEKNTDIDADSGT